MVKRSFLCWFFGVVYPFFSHFRFQSSFLFFVHLPQFLFRRLTLPTKKKKRENSGFCASFFGLL
ncbi:hypothetical protein E1A91_D07G091200v1 [Gossypium mustelinum]|uniref:Uncharacterized protein n=1 Tax=Gossypium mustelinum TaxID=34275 RepID=A0A5D2U5S9_GOSMU|nr:hypothetical protein E1A91_D07G091200v1 [Gossypium mustelinum]